jgi:hypothetical protein
MSTMVLLWSAVLPHAEGSPDPADVKAGWGALGIFVLMGIAVVLLAFSLVKHLRRTRANFDARDGIDDDGASPRP